MLLFISGLFIGVSISVSIMSLIAIDRYEDTIYERNNEERESTNL